MNDYPDTIIELATTVVILGTGTQKTVRELCRLFGFNSLLAESMNNLGKPGPKGANFVSLFKTSEGNVYQTLTNTISSMALWAFSSTSEDRTVRDALYQIIGPSKARKLLAKQYPGGSVKAEIERRKLLYEDQYLLDGQKSVEQTLIDELTALSKQL
jgi:intracellular multiplication protein IcmB